MGFKSPAYLPGGSRVHGLLAQSQVKIAYGTHCGMFPFSHGILEFQAMVKAGLSPIRAPKSATTCLRSHRALIPSLVTASLLSVVWLTAQQTTSPVAPENLLNTAPPQQPASLQPKSSLKQITLTGAWGGERTKLRNAGILLRVHFLTESAGDPVSGETQAACYTQQVDLGADLDLGRLIDLSGRKIEITFTDRAGRSISADAIGNQFAVQELYGAGQSFRLA